MGLRIKGSVYRLTKWSSTKYCFKRLPPLDIKEFLISGIAPTKNSFIYFDRKPIQTVFVTNAVANSVVFYAMAYLNNKCLSPNEIKNMRKNIHLIV